LRDRNQLFDDLSEQSKKKSNMSRLLTVFEFTNLTDHLAMLGTVESEKLCSDLADAFASVVAECGVGYRLRGTEFAFLVAGPPSHRTVLLDTVPSALKGRAAGWEIELISCEVMIPAEAVDAQGAMRLAGHRLDVERLKRAIEPRPLLGNGAAGAIALQELSRRTPRFFRSYDRVTSDYLPSSDPPSIRIGETVLYGETRSCLQGISPASLPERFAELQDLETGRCLRVPLDKVVADYD
jgi:hypothetical protein